MLVKKGHMFVSDKDKIKIPLDFAVSHFKVDFDDPQPCCNYPNCNPIKMDEIDGEIIRERIPGKAVKRYNYFLELTWSVRETRKIKWSARSAK